MTHSKGCMLPIFYLCILSAVWFHEVSAGGTLTPGGSIARGRRNLLFGWSPALAFDNRRVAVPELVLPHFLFSRKDPAVAPFVFGGERVDPARYPYIASLRRPDSEHHFCGGMLIAPDVVLTAAHCVDPTLPNGGELRPLVHIGRFCRACGSEDIEVALTKESITHPEWTGNILDGHDVALIMLDRALRTQPVRVVSAEAPAATLTAADVLTVAGWGFMDSTSVLSNFLLEGSLPYLNNRRCNLAYRQIVDRDVVKPDMMCAGGPGAGGGGGACRGDSGGPLLVADPNGDPAGDVVVGVVSFGAGCGQDAIPAVYSRLTENLDFLSDFLPGPSLLPPPPPSPSPPPPPPPPSPSPPPPPPPPPPSPSPPPPPTDSSPSSPPPTPPPASAPPRRQLVSPRPTSGCHDEFQVRLLFGVCPYGLSAWRRSLQPAFVDTLTQSTGIQEASVQIGSGWGWGLRSCSCKLYTRVYTVMKAYSRDEADALARFVSKSSSVLAPFQSNVDSGLDCAANLRVVLKRSGRTCF
mmetsp:Transcript_31157/g.88349  ORF Transcript_31157/g.88349 Transcript_31157/m.88349 type:complete len:523 (-) Transcript_31157:11-1579(-)